MNKVKKLIAAGASIPAAVKLALPMLLAEFADKYGMHRTRASAVINGTVRATDEEIGAFVAELGGSESEWRELFWQAAKPTAVAS